MAKRLLLPLAASLLAGACHGPVPDDPTAGPEAGRSSAGHVALQFEVVENLDAGGFRAALTLTNHRSAELPSTGWELYFNFGRRSSTRACRRASR